jgi:hypothetical protein
MGGSHSDSLGGYSTCPLLTPEVENSEGWQARSPAMAAGLAGHAWSLRG